MGLQDHSCALIGGAVSCWGRNDNGQVMLLAVFCSFVLFESLLIVMCYLLCVKVQVRGKG